jgi:hypothetical protein
MRLTTPATTSGTGGQGISMFYGASAAYSGYSGSGLVGMHEETYYSMYIRFPIGWQATVGDWNWLWEWHDDTTSINELASFGKNTVSCAIGVVSSGTLTSPDGPGTNPRFLYQLNGGPTNNPNYEKFYTSIPVPTGVWLKFYAHFIWDADPAIGYARIAFSSDRGSTWTDIVSPRNRATLFRRTDNSMSYNTHGLYNYHSSANYPISQDFDEWYIGRTAPLTQLRCQLTPSLRCAQLPPRLGWSLCFRQTCKTMVPRFSPCAWASTTMRPQCQGQPSSMCPTRS